MATRQPFSKLHWWKSTGFYPFLQVMCSWSLDLIFKAKLKLESKNRKIQYCHQSAILKMTLLKINRLLSLHTSNMWLKFRLDIQSHTKESRNKKIQYGCQAAILKVISLKINSFLPMATNEIHIKFEIEIPKQTRVTLQNPCQQQSPDTAKSNMAARWPFWKWHC